MNHVKLQILHHDLSIVIFLSALRLILNYGIKLVTDETPSRLDSFINLRFEGKCVGLKKSQWNHYSWIARGRGSFTIIFIFIGENIIYCSSHAIISIIPTHNQNKYALLIWTKKQNYKKNTYFIFCRKQIKHETWETSFVLHYWRNHTDMKITHGTLGKILTCSGKYSYKVYPWKIINPQMHS